MIVLASQGCHNLLCCNIPDLDAKPVRYQWNQVAKVLAFAWTSANCLQGMVAFAGCEVINTDLGGENISSCKSKFHTTLSKKRH